MMILDGCFPVISQRMHLMKKLTVYFTVVIRIKASIQRNSGCHVENSFLGDEYIRGHTSKCAYEERYTSKPAYEERYTSKPAYEARHTGKRATNNGIAKTLLQEHTYPIPVEKLVNRGYEHERK